MLALETTSIFHYSAVIDRLRSMVEPPTACHRPLKPALRPVASAVTPSTTRPREVVAMSTKPPAPPPGRHPGRSRRLRPARDSIHDILRRHADSSLFVRPICWTDMHARLLGANFHELPPCNTPLPESIPGSPPSKGHLRPTRAIKVLSEALTEILLPETRPPLMITNTMGTILATLWPNVFARPQVAPTLPIFFGDRVYRDIVYTQLMFCYPEDDEPSSQSSFRSISTRPAESYGLCSSSEPAIHKLGGLPMLCYIGKERLTMMRRNLFRISTGPGNSCNEPVLRLQQLRSKAWVPENSDTDAYLVGIFLAMAQHHFYGRAALAYHRDHQRVPLKMARFRPAFEDIKLRIMTHDSDTAQFIIYTGHVTCKFLERFYDPFRAPTLDEDEDGVAGIKIEFTKVPIWPILGLKERLGNALGEDMVGQFDPNEMETWESDESHDSDKADETEVDDDAPKKFKRKRQSLSEVFNGSFDDDTEEDEREFPPSQKSKKQRLGAGSPIGVGA